MKNLLYITSIGALFGIVSEIFEMLGIEFSEVSLWITFFAFLFLAIGFWGLHKQQCSKTQNILSLIGTTLTSISMLIFAIFAYQLLAQKSSTIAPAGNGESPLFMIGVLAMVVGIILVGISIIRVRFYPSWTGISMIVLILLSLAVPIFSLPSICQNISNILISAIIIFMASIHFARQSTQEHSLGKSSS